jgi:hypothetical protein
MDCSQIRDAFANGVQLPEDQIEEHLARCPQCRALFEHDAELGRSLAAQASEVLPFSDDIFGQLERRLARETGPRAWLRSRPSRLRFALVLVPLLLVLIAGGLLRQRADFAQYPLLRVGLLLCVYFLAILLAFAKKLSELPRRDPLRDHLALLAFAIAVPVLAGFAPATEVSRQAGAEGAFGCFAYGALLTLPIALLLWTLDRDDRPSLRTVCLSAAALGLSANLLLELHCGNGNPAHVLLGHASLGLAWLAVWAFARSLTRT